MYRIGRIIFYSLNVLPVVVAIAIFCFFLRARIYLGHLPRVSIDDPKILPFWESFSCLWNPLMVSYLVLLLDFVAVFVVNTLVRSQDRRIAVNVIVLNWMFYICLHVIPGINILEWYID